MQEAYRVPFSVATVPLRTFLPPRTLAPADRLLPLTRHPWPSKEQLRISRTGLQHGSLETAAYLVCLCRLRGRGGFSPLPTSQNTSSIRLLMSGIAFLWTKPSIPQQGPRNRSERTRVWHCPQAVLGHTPAGAVPSARNILPAPSFSLP